MALRGLVGDRLCTGLVALVAGCAATVLGPIGAAAAAPSPADLVVDVATDTVEVGPAGGSVALSVSVGNVGGLEANDTVVKIGLPAGAALSFGDPPGGWRCDAEALKCRYGTLAARSDAAPLALTVTLPAGDHGRTVTIGGTASTSSREASTANNTDRAEVRYVVRADLALEMTPEISEVSSLGGNGSRAFVHIRVTNVGTQDAPDVRLTVQPPAVGRLEAENFVPDGWSCDVSGPTWICTTGPLAVGAIAYLNVVLRFPAGTVGDTLTMSGVAATTAEERSLDNNTDEVAIRYVTPAPADLVVAGVAANPHQVRSGDTVEVTVHLDNHGGSPAENVTVRIPLPATVQVPDPDPGNADWICTVRAEAGSGERFWECTRPHVDMGELTNVLTLRARVGAGTPDGTLTFTATASTTSSELSLDNNTAPGGTTYIAEGIVGGRVWHDLDRDGQRDADEPHAEFDVGRIEFVLEGTEPTWDTPRAIVNNVDGTYFARLEPGRYFVRVLLHASSNVDFTVPDVGDDATDSDILTSTPTSQGPIGDSAIIEVLDGGTVTVDVGIAGTTG